MSVVCVVFAVACGLLSHFVFFFFKQKTAYDSRIGDWSSDLCSSDLDMSLSHAYSRVATSSSQAMTSAKRFRASLLIISGASPSQAGRVRLVRIRRLLSNYAPRPVAAGYDDARALPRFSFPVT